MLVVDLCYIVTCYFIVCYLLSIYMYNHQVYYKNLKYYQDLRLILHSYYLDIISENLEINAEMVKRVCDY